MDIFIVQLQSSHNDDKLLSNALLSNSISHRRLLLWGFRRAVVQCCKSNHLRNKRCTPQELHTTDTDQSDSHINVDYQIESWQHNWRKPILTRWRFISLRHSGQQKYLCLYFRFELDAMSLFLPRSLTSLTYGDAGKATTIISCNGQNLKLSAEL